MEEFQGAYGNWYKGVFFTEGVVRVPSSASGRIVVEINRQNSNLTEVKNEMAQQAASRGANVIQNFKYGQKAHNWRDLVFSFKWDTESWHGSGDAVTVQ
ncbi:MAG: hypothetical protein EBZ49_06190 [Proteobacteria bacterium]|nr:hypothetical protein [Pseudomonadota bacterium]